MEDGLIFYTLEDDLKKKKKKEDDLKKEEKKKTTSKKWKNEPINQNQPNWL
jgi:hypothetical protein